MQTFKWLYNRPYHWGFIVRVLVKAAVLFVLLNLLFAAIRPLPALGQLSIYNVIVPGRERLPYGENPALSHNLSLYPLEPMFASHVVEAADPADYNILIFGDSSVWGVLLRPEDTLAGQINRAEYRTADGRRVRAYNLGYPTMSLLKDLMLLDYAVQRYDADLMVWLVTLESFDTALQLDPAFVRNNPDRVRDLIERYDLNQNPADPRLVDTGFWDETIIGRRRDLADWLRLQWYGVAWAETEIDQVYGDYTPRSINLPAHELWQDYAPEQFDGPEAFAEVLAFDVLAAGMARIGSTPVLLVNEPIFISDGANSDLRYNQFYPRWAYDAYRRLLAAQVHAHGWQFLDAWDALPDAACYTDSPVHLTPACSEAFSRIVVEKLAQITAVVPHP